jgi:hypothetical protein
MNREWHMQYQYLLMEIAHAVNALHSGNNGETIVKFHNNKIAENCAKLVALQDTSIHLLEPSISARRVQWRWLEAEPVTYYGRILNLTK